MNAKQQFDSAPSATSNPGTDYAALENVDVEFQALLGKVGRDVICVCLSGHRDSETWREKELARNLGAELETAGCGAFDSDAITGSGRYLIFFHTRPQKLGRALSALKESLQKRALLSLAQILAAEPESGLFRVYHPPTADLV